MQANETHVERRDLELVVTRLVDAPVALVFKAWTTPELFRRWWVPASFGIAILGFEMEARTGGTYRFEMHHAASGQTMTFFGRYLEVTPDARIVWTNEESAAGPLTTASFEPRGDQTLVTVRDLYPSQAAIEEAIASGSTGGWSEQLAQLEQLLGEGAAV